MTTEIKYHNSVEEFKAILALGVFAEPKNEKFGYRANLQGIWYDCNRWNATDGHRLGTFARPRPDVRGCEFVDEISALETCFIPVDTAAAMLKTKFVSYRLWFSHESRHLQVTLTDKKDIEHTFELPILAQCDFTTVNVAPLPTDDEQYAPTKEGTAFNGSYVGDLITYGKKLGRKDLIYAKFHGHLKFDSGPDKGTGDRMCAALWDFGNALKGFRCLIMPARVVNQ